MMKIDETKQAGDVKNEAQALIDLPVNAEQANETNGGINFQAIKYDYRPQCDKDN